ncbi:hypothetical protein [uncultured Campylobacter sp.]|uniref:hypothetical protein n=1 Tax=uncultured Campylobacter sp. TaxID=218934 RepID=UPI002605660F|nr:hypothetical protein [uncultured Campylobacter sp.]
MRLVEVRNKDRAIEVKKQTQQDSMEKQYEQASIIEKFQSVSFFTQYKSNLMQSFEILYCDGGLDLKLLFAEDSKILRRLWNFKFIKQYLLAKRSSRSKTPE